MRYAHLFRGIYLPLTPRALVLIIAVKKFFLVELAQTVEDVLTVFQVELQVKTGLVKTDSWAS